jgi:hypothetical protein
MVVPDAIKTKIPAPAARASVDLARIERLGHGIRVSNLDTPTSRALPRGSVGYAVFSAVHDHGTPPPSDERDFRFEGVGTRPTFFIKYRGGDAGKRATVYVRYLNRKGQLGPASPAVSCLIAA